MTTVATFLYSLLTSEDDGPKLSATVAVIAGLLALSRFFIISVRHGISPPSLMQRLKDKPITQEDLNEALIFFAWLSIKPEQILLEIDKACVTLSVAKETFTIKTLLPVYPLQAEKLMDANFYKKNELGLKDIAKQEKDLIKAIEPVLF